MRVILYCVKIRQKPFCLIFRVHLEMEAVFSLEERDAFHDEIKRHLLSTVGIDISKFHIRKFSLPIIALSESGKVFFCCFKAKSFGNSHSVLIYFSDAYI